MYIDAILRYGNETAFWNRMAAIGHPMKTNEDGSVVKIEKRAFKVITPPLEDINGDKFLRARMTADDANKLPPDNNPAFSIQWRSDEFENDGLWPEPEVEVNTYDIDGNVTGTRMQAIGGF